MTLELWYLKGKQEAWAEQACDEFAHKISRFFSFSRLAIKSKSKDRDSAEEKKNAEGEALMSKLRSGDFLVLFDEAGRRFKSSRDFSAAFVRTLSEKPGRVVFVIGGPYGYAEALLKRAQARWSLSELTMNHHVAQVVALEQIYRALTIWKGLPYHND